MVPHVCALMFLQISIQLENTYAHVSLHCRLFLKHVRRVIKFKVKHPPFTMLIVILPFADVGGCHDQCLSGYLLSVCRPSAIAVFLARLVLVRVIR